MLGSLFAGFSGSIFAGLQAFVNPVTFGFMISVIVVSMVVLGGMGSIPGVIVGAIALDSLPEIIRHTFSDWLPAVFGEGFYSSWPQQLQDFFLNFDTYRMLIFGGLLVAVMIFRPEGIIPNSYRRKELHDMDSHTVEEASMVMFDLEQGREELNS
jgi:branched-chain amino acid transport system permease protein